MTEATTRIGLVDDNLDNFHARTYLAAIRGPLRSRGFEVAGATARDREPSEAWARAQGVRYFATVAELGPEVDCFAVLAPATPECHLELCEQTLPHGKATFVDKTFAPDEATACRIFSLADRFGAPIQTTSALRTSNIQRRLAELDEPLECLLISASGPAFGEYGIHPVELAVSCLGHEAVDMACTGSPGHLQIVLRFQGDRTAVIDFAEGSDAPFGVSLVTRRRSEHLEVDFSTLFDEAAAAILDFFAADRALIDRRETLLVRRILDRARGPGSWGAFQPLQEPAAARLEGPHWGAEVRSPAGGAADRQQR
jgi:predicted dehydrogenase